nr:MAG TPA: hypothetical protein [Caudoviricetes sp.]
MHDITSADNVQACNIVLTHHNRCCWILQALSL